MADQSPPLEVGGVIDATVRVGRGVVQRTCIVDGVKRTDWGEWWAFGRFDTAGNRWSKHQRVLMRPWIRRGLVIPSESEPSRGQ